VCSQQQLGNSVTVMCILCNKQLSKPIGIYLHTFLALRPCFKHVSAPVLSFHCYHMYYCTETKFIIKVVIWLSVNRLPVKLPITGFIFKLSIYRHFSLRNEISSWIFISIVFTHSHRQTKMY